MSTTTYGDGTIADSFIGANAAITWNGAEGKGVTSSPTAIADTDPTNDGPPYFITTEYLVGTFYANPKADIEQVTLSLKDMVLATDQGDVTAANYSTTIETNMVDAMIQLDDASGYLDNTTIHYYKDGVDTGVSTLVEDGGITINNSVVFDEIRLSDDAYISGTTISDAVEAYNYLVGLSYLGVDSLQFHAADVDNNDNVTISDAVAIERHLVNLDPINGFDLIDAQGNRVTSLDTDSSADMQTWMIVANGDVNLSGSFDDAYVIASDLV